MNDQKKDAVINLRISSDLKKRLADQCWERKMKMTSAIEDAIEQWLERESTQTTQTTQAIQSKDFTTQNNLETRLERIEENYLDRESAIELIKEIIADAQVPIWDTLLGLHQRDRDSLQKQENQKQEIETNQKTLNEGLTQKELAGRWNISSRAISNAKKKDQIDWEKYCQKYDPDRLVWYISGRKYYPNKTE